MIFLMGLFSVYTGLVYNDVFSQAMTLMHSAYTFKPETDSISNTTKWIGEKDEGSTYGFGVDPAWHGAENSLIFTNSYKMKMAVIFGVIHVCVVFPISTIFLPPFSRSNIPLLLI